MARSRPIITRQELNELLRRPLQSITIDELHPDGLTVDYLVEILTRYEVPHNSKNQNKANLLALLIAHRDNIIHSRSIDAVERDTSPNPTALMMEIPTPSRESTAPTVTNTDPAMAPGLDDRTSLDGVPNTSGEPPPGNSTPEEPTGASTHDDTSAFDLFVKEIRDSEACLRQELLDSNSRLLQRVSDIKAELELRINTVDGNSMTRSNGVSATAKNVFHTEIAQLNLPTTQTVLDTVATATAPTVSNVQFLDQALRQTNDSLRLVALSLDDRLPQATPWSSLLQPITYSLQSTSGGVDISGGVGTSGGVAPSVGGTTVHTSNSHSAAGMANPHPLFPQIDMNTGRRIQDTNTTKNNATTSNTPTTPMRTTNPYAPAVRRHWSPMNEVDSKRASDYSLYLGGRTGYVDGLQEQRFLELGFHFGYYREVRDALGELLRDWSTPVFNVKYKDSLHPLQDLSIESWVNFYTHLTSDLKFYHIGLVPFDAIVLKYGYVGLVLPGVGDDRYLPMAQVLYNVLERLLPVDDPTIRMCNDSASGYTMDGFRWLHGIFTNFLPAFSPYIMATPPLWHEVRDISRFAKLYNLYYRFLALQSVYHTDVVRSRAFLAGIDEESLRPSIISLQTSTRWGIRRPH
jgi:hypothetical protein